MNRKRLWAGATLAAILACAAPAVATRVKGVVSNFRLLENPVWTEAKELSKHGFSFREPVATVRAEYRKLYGHVPKELCIAALSAAPQKPPPPYLVRVGGGRTTPVTIVVPPGTQLSFQNTDPFKHRLYVVGLKTFPANDTGKGANRDWTVPGPGVFEIRDELAPSLRSFVIGEPNVAAIGYPSLKGEFLLSIRDPGDYTIQAYFAGKKVGEARPLAITDRDADISNKPIVVATPPKGKDDKPTDKPTEEK
jgi:hypothetical protein